MTRRLITTQAPRQIEAAVLVLHGGASRNVGMQVSPTQLSVLRMIPIARRLARAGHRRVAVFRLVNSVRGWDAEHTPVEDVRWALRELREQLPPSTPVGLVGHSLGGRAAILSLPEDQVQCVTALAPWVYPADGSLDASGRDVLIVHGSADRIADPTRSEAAAQLLRRTARTVRYVRVVGGTHAMLRRHSIFGQLAAEFTMSSLLGDGSTRPNDILETALAGTPVDV